MKKTATPELLIRSVKIPSDLIPKIKRIAGLENRNQQDVIADALADYVRRYETIVGREITEVNVRELMSRIDEERASEKKSARKTAGAAKRSR
jgi:metal-responsive CopG/Arc/MetJ family transcriptional regulator